MRISPTSIFFECQSISVFFYHFEIKLSTSANFRLINYELRNLLNIISVTRPKTRLPVVIIKS